MKQFSLFSFSKYCILFLGCLSLKTNVNADFSLSDGTYCDGTGWVPYKDEKCFKIILNWATRDAANKSSAQEWLQADSSIPQLVTIKSVAEQDFLTNWVFAEEEVMINVWIGAKRLADSNDFVWDDGSAVDYSNWADDGPSEEAKSACVVMQSRYVKNQLQLETNKVQHRVNGKWRDMFCEQPSYFICEKLPRWSFQKVQQTLLEQRKELVGTKNELVATKSELNANIANLKQNSIPLGFIYAQLPNEKSPTEIWPWMLWTDVSDAYGGVFFRVNGGRSEPFGTIQDDNSPRLVRMESFLTSRDSSTFNSLNQNQTLNEYAIGQATTISATIHTGDHQSGNHIILRFVKSDGEVRPRNMAIRVWKRTG